MRVFVLGASGLIGTAITDELLAHGHTVAALARSDASAERLRQRGAEIVPGDLRNPEAWASVVADVETVIHVAATFTDDMGAVDRRLLQALIGAARTSPRPARFVYTGGCWLFGETGDRVATEDTPFDPIPAFAWMAENWALLIAAGCFDSMLLHPAMVYHRDGGAIDGFLEAARDRQPMEIWGSAETRWPVVHRRDLASAYRRVAERGQPGSSYCVATEPGVRVGAIAGAIAQRFGVPDAPVVLDRHAVLAREGDWAAGPMLDQQMQGDRIRQTLGWRPAVPNILACVGSRAANASPGGDGDTESGGL